MTTEPSMLSLRRLIANSAGLPTKTLPCFTLSDHNDSPAILILHFSPTPKVLIQSDTPDSKPLRFIPLN